MVLGAGFSRPAGLPLATSLWSEIREMAASFPEDSRASKFRDDLDDYLRFQMATEGNCDINSINFEDFMSFLDVEHFLGLRGGDTWSEEGNEGTVVTKYLIGKILARYQSQIAKIPDLYLEFANSLRQNDIIITFNYDTLLETALDETRTPYRLFPTRFSSVDDFGGVVDSEHDEVVILKVHGSLDWFDKTHYIRMRSIFAAQGAPPVPDIIFDNADTLDLVPILDGPYHSDHPLKNVYRARDLSYLYSRNFLFHATPRMLAPSSVKLVYANRLSNFWDGLGRAGLLNFGMAIIGFSMPSQDEYAKQIMYRLVRNYQTYRWGESDFGLRKSPLAIVDYFPDDAAEARFRERYRFVDWSRASVDGGGFTLASLDSIFA
jgi:hypothetical protein